MYYSRPLNDNPSMRENSAPFIKNYICGERGLDFVTASQKGIEVGFIALVTHEVKPIEGNLFNWLNNPRRGVDLSKKGQTINPRAFYSRHVMVGRSQPGLGLAQDRPS
jgi:hypothetical protein